MSDLPADPALASAVLEIEAHVGRVGWDQPARLYALVPTADLVAQEPALAAAMEIDGPGDEGSFTPIEQDGLPEGTSLEDALEGIAWPPTVAGCAAVVERLVLPPEVDDEIPADAMEAELFAREHPLRQEVRIVAGATRAGASYCALRLRAHDDEQSVVDGTELVPGLIALLHQTLEHGALDADAAADAGEAGHVDDPDDVGEASSEGDLPASDTGERA